MEGPLFFWSATPEVGIDHGKLVHSQHGRELLQTVTTNSPINIHERGARRGRQNSSSLSRGHDIVRGVEGKSLRGGEKRIDGGNQPERAAYLTQDDKTLYPAITLPCFIKPFTLPSNFSVSSNPVP